MKKKLAIIVLFFGLQPLFAQQIFPTVLVEMFSSEGCSSCAEADGFMKELINRADSTHAPVFVLDYHVDIWNRSGWVDPYSKSEFTQKQKNYMAQQNQLSHYTPMVFINGLGGLPGGAKKEIGLRIQQQLAQKPKLNIATQVKKAQDSMLVQFSLNGPADSCKVVAIWAYKQITNKVTGGENAGKELTHHHVVISASEQTTIQNNQGSLLTPIPANIAPNQLLLITYVQHVRTLQIFATDQLDFR
ncbi:MAG: DUF1223 domain-containing protein [Bacteroidia bacterium]|jgi:hypothetical protein|nr:DUF1223 domain-containing protein [Bacteroidia bacterium]